MQRLISTLIKQMALKTSESILLWIYKQLATIWQWQTKSLVKSLAAYNLTS